MDAAILFSDILTVPHALGRHVTFEESRGPLLTPLEDRDVIALDAAFHATLTPVYRAVGNIRAAMEKEGFHDTSLIGFSGAPWTLACYMIEGGSSRDFQRARQWIIIRPKAFSHLMDTLTQAVTEYLLKQVEAGAEALQLFDSWAGVLPAEEFVRWIVEPTQRIVRGVKDTYPTIPIIGFPRLAGINYRLYAEQTGVDAISVDCHVPLPFMRELQNHAVVQGNLDPLLLAENEDAAIAQATSILTALGDKPFVFNLGHGILPHTPPAHVARLSEFLQQSRPDS